MSLSLLQGAHKQISILGNTEVHFYFGSSNYISYLNANIGSTDNNKMTSCLLFCVI